MTSTAIDISQYSGDVSIEGFRKAKEAGCSRVIVALNNLSLAVRQAKNAQAAGLEVEAYIYYYFAQSMPERTRACLAAIAGLGIKRVWMDAEDEKHDLKPSVLASKLRYVQGLIEAAGYSTGIYTAAWWWNKWMDGQDFTDLPLWDAYWDKDADIDTPTYGGWKQAEMSQHTNDTTYAGIWCDINSYRSTEPVPIRPPSTNAEQTALALVKSAIRDMQAAERLLEVKK